MERTKSVDRSETRGKTGLLENYNVEETIKMVRELGSHLIESTNDTRQHVNHQFKREWIDQLVARYRKQPGKPVIHLSDLPGQVIPTLSPDVRDLLLPYWEKLVNELGSEWGSRHFRCMWDIVKSGKGSRWSSLRLWRRFGEQTGFRIDSLEPFTLAIRAANTGTSRVILNPRLPINLATPDGAKLFGYRGDASHDTSAIHNLDENVHDDYLRAITATVGNMPFTRTIEKGNMIRTNVGVFITIVTSLGGLDNARRQKLARNPIPGWFFQTGEPTRISCLRTTFEAEGSPTRDGVRLSQGVGWDPISVPGLPKWPLKIPFGALPRESRNLFLTRPPLMLVSAALLLFQLGIKSYIFPSKASFTKSGVSVYWFLQIYRTVNMRRFEQAINFVSDSKRAKLAKYNALHKPKSSPPPFSEAQSSSDR